jgi:hypothetical protein
MLFTAKLQIDPRVPIDLAVALEVADATAEEHDACNRELGRASF